MITPCKNNDFSAIYAIINDAARAYAGVIPADRTRPEVPKQVSRAVQKYDYLIVGAGFSGSVLARLRSEKTAVRIKERPVVFLDIRTIEFQIRSIVASYTPPPLLMAKRKLWQMAGLNVR